MALGFQPQPGLCSDKDKKKGKSYMVLFLKKGRIGEAAREGGEVPTPVWGWCGVRDKRKRCCDYGGVCWTAD